MTTLYFFLGCLLFFGIPACITEVIGYTKQKQLSAKIKNEFLAKFK